MKRFLSLLLTVAMVFSCMSITALAEDEAAAVVFELYGSTNVATQAYAHAGSKVMLTAVEGATAYKKNGAAYNAVAGPVAGTVLFDVSAGSNIFTAVVGDVEYNVPFYGVSALSKGTATNLPTTNLGTEVTEGPFVVGAHTVAYAVRADKFYQDEAYTAETAPTDVVVSGKNQVDGAKDGDTNNVYSYGFYIDGTLEAPFNVMDIMGGYYSSSGTLPTYKGTYKNSGRALITINPGNEVVVTGCDDEPIYTGYVVSSDAWHDVAVTANLPNREKANVYIDGVLVAKTPYIAAGATLDKWRGPVLFAPSGPSNAYVGGSTNLLNLGGGDRTMFEIYNGGVTFPEAPAIAPAMDGETPVENTVAVTYEPALDIADYEIKVFANGEEVETMATEGGYYILVDKAIPNAQVQVKIVDPNGNVAFDHKGNELVSNIIEDMDLEVPENINKVFEHKYEYANYANDTIAHAGSYIVAKAVLGATYYNNGTPIEDYIFDMEAGTVSLPVNAGYNNFTAVRNGQKLGYISVYGLSYAVESKQGAHLPTASDPSGFALTLDTEVTDRKAYKVASQTTAYKFTNTMVSTSGTIRKSVGVGYAFYLKEKSEQDFTVMNLSATSAVNFQLIVTPEGDLKFRDYNYATTKETYNTGYKVEPGHWYDLNVVTDTANNSMLNVYVDRELVAKAYMLAPGSKLGSSFHVYCPNGDGVNTYVGNLASKEEILNSAVPSGKAGVYAGGSTYSLFYVQRNGDYNNRPTEKFAAATVSGATVTATGVTSFADRAVYFDGTLVYTNGATVANDKGITVTAEGDSFTFASSKASYPEADVEIYAVDPMGCKVNGMYGALKATAKVSVESSYVEPTLPAPSQVGGAFNTFTVPGPDFTDVTDPTLLAGTSALYIDGEKAQGTQTEQGFVVESATTKTATAYTVLVDAQGNVINGISGEPIKSEEVQITLVSSATINNTVFALKYDYTESATSAFAHVGANVVAKPVVGATYKLNGAEVALTPDFATGTVKLPVNEGLNIYTAEKGDTVCGKITFYGVSLTAPGAVGASMMYSYGLTTKENGEELADKRSGFLADKVSDANHFFDKGMETRNHVGHGLAFYLKALPTEEFIVLNLQETNVKDADGAINFQLFVDTLGNLKFRDYTKEEFDTGLDIVPGQWYELNSGITYEDNGAISVYINKDLVARAHIYAPTATAPDTLCTFAPTGDGVNTYFGRLKDADEILTSTLRKSPNAGYGVQAEKSGLGDDGTQSIMAYIQRNSKINTAVPSMTAKASGNVVTVTETDMTDYAAYTGRKVLVNGVEPETLGITVSQNGAEFTFSSFANYGNAKIEIFAVDAQGNKAPGPNGAIMATVTMNITGNATFAFAEGTYDANQAYVNAGAKMIVNTNITDGTYKNNGVEFTPDAIADGKLLFPVEVGNNVYTVEKDGMLLGTLSIYGFKAVAEAQALDMSGDFKAFDETVGRVVTEGAMIKDGHDYAVEITADRVLDPDSRGEEYHSADDFIVHTYGLNSAVRARTHTAFALGFYIDGALAGDFNVLDIHGSYNNRQYVSGKNLAAQYGTLRVTINTENEVVVTDRNGNVTNTGYKVTADEWHDLVVTSNYSAKEKARIYVDGVLVATATFNTGVYGSAGWVVYKPSGAGNGYVGDASGVLEVGEFPRAVSGGTSMAYADYRVAITGLTAPTVAQVTKEVDDVAYPVNNTITVTGSAPAEIEGAELKVFVNGEEATTTVDGSNLVIQSAVAIPGAKVYVAAVDADGNIVSNYEGTVLKSTEITMNIVANDLPTVVEMDEEGKITVYRDLLGEDIDATLAVVSIFSDKTTRIDLLEAGYSEAQAPEGAVKVFVWIWNTLKPLVENLIK